MANIFNDLKNTRIARNPLESLSRFGKILASGQAPADNTLDTAYRVAQINALNNKSAQPNFLLGTDGDLMPLPSGKIIQKKSGFVPQNTEIPDGFVRTPDGRILKDPSYQPPMSQKDKFELEQKQRAMENQAQMVKDSAQDVLGTVGEVRKGMKFFGPMGDVPTILSPSSLIPGEYDKRKNWEVNVNKLLSEKIVNLMAEMKNASRTGATGFGQLSGPELAILQGASTALKKGLSPQDADRYLTQIENMEKRVLGIKSNDTGSQVDYKSKYGLI